VFVSQAETKLRSRREAAKSGFLGRFRASVGGQLSVMFALCATMLITTVGAGIDYSRAFVARQALSNAATLTCQYSARPSVLATVYNGASGLTNYLTSVGNYANTFLLSQSFGLSQTNGSPFTYSPGGISQVSLSANVPTYFLGIIGVSTVPVSVKVACNGAQTEASSNQSNIVLQESFETAACSGTCWGAFQPNGAINQLSATPTNTFPTTVGYVGSSNAEWSIMGYCLEIDSVGIIKSTVPDGTHSAELDCDNGSGSAGNSSISNKTYYTAGTYELRYNYSGRIAYNNYSPIYICGSQAADVAWANDTNSAQGASARTNQINVYFDADNNGAPATHTTIDGTQTLAGSNLIDTCVYSVNWLQRSVMITVTTAGYYWLSFAADGSNDSYGGQIDNVMVCRTSCSGSVTDNFPSAWSNTLLFEDSFESPSQTDNCGGCGASSPQNLNTSYGASGGSPPGWPAQTASGWATGGYNQVGYYVKSSESDAGNQSIYLDVSSKNDSASRQFYLDPGYYKLQYDYVSNAIYSSLKSSPYCTAAPTSALTSYAYTGSISGTNRTTGATLKDANDTNAVAVFMSHGSLVSYPVGGGATGSQTSYVNPTGTTTTTPTVAPDALTISTYNGTQLNPLLDYCYYSNVWTTRTTYIQITKPGPYWLTISAKGTADGIGGAVDDVRLTALNSLYGTAPSFYVTIPTPGASPGGTVSFTGFTILADRLTP
jgi:hypothetical protein